MLDEALAYFRGKSGFRRLFPLFRKKMESLGRVGGSVDITDFKDAELEEIAAFFGSTKEVLLQKKKIYLLRFEKKLGETRFAGVDVWALLEGYFDEKIVSKKESHEQKRAMEERALERWKGQYPALAFWFDYLRARSPDTHWVYRLLENGRLAALLPVIHDAVRNLPEEPIRLPVFSQKVSGDPHAFDMNHDAGKLLMHILQVKSGLPAVNGSEEATRLLESFYILRDDITNDVSVANLLADVGENVHPLWQAAVDTRSVLNIPLRELQRVSAVYPITAGRVWIVENSGVYSSLLDAVPDAPLICTRGQFKLAALKLMDMLVDAGVTLFYAGDIDPEGVAMADRLLARYPRHAQLWRMDIASYHKSLSDNHMEEERMAKLLNVTNEALLPVIRDMQEKRKAGYQEGLLSLLAEDLRQGLGENK
ncbi:TIGR02679 family protein [Salicibibacter cibarius]|uniref:TIGR02679 family protein n=1 Tax=Salicibibacter cibarius TaxID=2743000 RepID=A0A7T6Z544_9BACI|nr:TIGR02679 family protein [Salicibibacter cibarius]QQK76887.1 TIGR02679 family protein [Salicibibacter cibarius]